MVGGEADNGFLSVLWFLAMGAMAREVVVMAAGIHEATLTPPATRVVVRYTILIFCQIACAVCSNPLMYSICCLYEMTDFVNILVNYFVNMQIIDFVNTRVN